MAPPVAYFDLLEDGLVQEVIRSLDGPPRNSWKSLSSTCLRMCTLVRATRHVKVDIASDLEGMQHLLRPPKNRDLDRLQHLLRLPRGRAFYNVRALSVHNFVEFSVAEWARFTDAVAAAAATWPMIEEVLLNAKLVQKFDSCLRCEPGCLSGPLMALRHARALRRLTVKLFEKNNLTYLPVLTQLTHLELYCEGMDSITIVHRPGATVAACPLADMTNLVSLQLLDADIAEDAHTECPCALPPNLTRLEATLAYGEWADHLAGCKQLRELQLTVPFCYMMVYPTVLIQGFAEQLTGLVKLSIAVDDSNPEGQMEQRFAEGLCEDSPEDWGVVEEEIMQLPLGGDYYLPAPYVLIPPPKLSALSSLQHLDVGSWWLAAPSERHWRVLGGCSSLRSLSGLHASVPPPAGVTFPGVTRLDVTTSTSPGDTLGLLGAFPALEELGLTLVPTDSSPDQPLGVPPVVLHELSSAHISFNWPGALDTAAAQAPCVAAYCSPLWAILPGVRKLVLQWPCTVPKFPTLKGEAAQRRVAAVALGAIQERYGYPRPALPVHVEAAQLLPVLQDATQLQSLDLIMELDPSSADQLVLGLQGALPGLVRLGTLDGAAGLAPATLAALRPGLVHALIEY